MRLPTQVETAVSWLDAMSCRDESGLLALSSPDIRLYGLKGPGKGPGPDGLAIGHAGLLKWLRAGPVSIAPSSALVTGDRVLLQGAGAAVVLALSGGKVASVIIETGPAPDRRHGFRGAERIELVEAVR